MKINNNPMALTAVRYMNYHQDRVARSIYRLSSGKKLPTDDPAGMLIAEKFRAKLRGLDAHIRNTEYMQASLDTAYGDRMSQQNLLGRMYEIAVQVSSDTVSWDDKNILMTEFNELAKEFSGMTMSRTGMEIVALNFGEYKGELAYKSGNKVYLEGEWQNLEDLVPIEPSTFIGKINPDDSVDFDGEGQEIGDLVTPDKNGTLAGIDISTETVEAPTIGLIDYVKGLINGNLSSMADIGAVASSLSFRLGRLYNEEANAAEALSRIEDIDFAKELTEFVKEKVLLQCATLMAAQANAHPDRVLYLLESTLQ